MDRLPTPPGRTHRLLMATFPLLPVLFIGRLGRLQATAPFLGVADPEALVSLPGLSDTIGLLAGAGRQVNQSHC
jgi:hypothetical protein